MKQPATPPPHRPPPPPPGPKEKPDPPESFFASEEWPAWRDRIAKHIFAAWFLNYDLRRLPPILRKARDGERLSIPEAARVVSSLVGLVYFASMAVGRGLRAGQDADVLETRYRERLRARATSNEKKDAPKRPSPDPLERRP